MEAKEALRIAKAADREAKEGLKRLESRARASLSGQLEGQRAAGVGTLQGELPASTPEDKRAALIAAGLLSEVVFFFSWVCNHGLTRAVAGMGITGPPRHVPAPSCGFVGAVDAGGAIHGG